MTKTIARTYWKTNEYRAYITYALLGMSAILVFLYALNIYSVVSKSVAVREITGNIAAISADVQELDGRYLELSNSITPEMLKSHGMSQGTVSAYISRTPVLGRVALRGNGL